MSILSMIKDIEEPNWWNEKSSEEQREEFACHPFAVREMAKQTEDLQRLKNIEKLDRNFLEWLRTSFDNGGKSLIDLS